MDGDVLVEGSKTNPADPDTDDDGVNDGDECGPDPLNCVNDPRHPDGPDFYEIDPPIA